MRKGKSNNSNYIFANNLVKIGKTIAFEQTEDSDTVLTYQVSSVQLVTNKKLEAFNKA